MPGVLAGRLMLFDGLEATFRTVRLRQKKINCDICGDNPTINELLDYEQFCGSKANDKNPNLNILKNDERITVEEYRDIKDSSEPHLLIDVRSSEEFEICHLENSKNIPYVEITKQGGLETTKKFISEKLEENNDTNGK